MFTKQTILAFFCTLYACNSYCCDSIVPNNAYTVTVSLSDSSTLNIQCPGRNRDQSPSKRPCFRDEMQCNDINGVNVCTAIPNDCSPDFQTRDFWNAYETQYRSACGFDSPSLDSQCIIEIGAHQKSDNGNGDKIHKFKVYKVGHYYEANDDDLSRWFIFTAGKEHWGNIQWPNGYNMNMDCVGRGGNGCKGDGGWSCPRQNWDTYGKDFLKHDVCNYFWRDCQDGSCSALNEHCGVEYDDANSECLFYGKPLGKDKCF